MSDDRELLIGMRDGDDAAAAEFCRRHQAALTRFCAGYVGADDADDAVSEVLRRVVRSGELPDNPRIWLRVVARNVCLNHLRGRARRGDRQQLASRVELVASLTGNLTRLQRAEERERLRAAFEQLTEEHREVLRLRYEEDLSRDDIAAILELSPSVVKSRLFEGMKKLRRFVGRDASGS